MADEVDQHATFWPDEFHLNSKDMSALESVLSHVLDSQDSLKMILLHPWAGSMKLRMMNSSEWVSLSEFEEANYFDDSDDVAVKLVSFH